jgi:multidrug efflux pump subunit AcrB
MDYFEIHRESKRNMMLGRGAEFEMRYSLGLAVFSGMVGVTFFGLFFTQVFY